MTRARDLANQADLTFDSLALESTDTSVNIGPIINLDRNSSSPAAWNKTGAIVWSGRNDADESVDYFQINSQIEDVADGTENGRLQFWSMRQGTLQETMFMNSWGDIYFQGYNPKLGWVDHKGTTNDLFVGVNDLTAGRAINFPDADGTLMVEDSNGNVGIGGAPTSSSLFIYDSDYQQLEISGNRPTIWMTEDDGNANENFQLRVNDGKFLIQQQNDQQSNAQTRVSVLQDGKVGIGTESPDKTLTVRGTSGDVVQAKIIYAGSDGNRSGLILQNTHTGGREYGLYVGNNSTGGGLGNSFGISDNTASTAYRLLISSDGHVTTPSQPSCSIYNCGFGSSATSWSSAGTGSVNGGLVGLVHHNNGNHYNTSTGYFTAPVAGHYLCNLNVYGKKDNNQGDNSGYWWGYFQKNGGDYYGNYIMEGYYNSGDYDQGASISAVIYLAVNDTVRPYMGAYAHGVQVYGPNTGFSCQLLG